MTDEITESAKAVQEVAKATGQAISTVDKIGSFFARIMGESIDATCGMLADKLKYLRWKHQVSLIDKVEKKIKEKGLSDKIRPVPPKIALPVFQYASLEEDESLHDIWANLLVTALDPSCEIPRSAFIGIIRQLEPVDVRILNFLYKTHLTEFEKDKERLEEQIERMRARRPINDDGYEKRLAKYAKESRNHLLNRNPVKFYPCEQSNILKELNMNYGKYLISIDNLMRQQLASSFAETVNAEVVVDAEENIKAEPSFFYDWGYLKVYITTLGISFVKACTVTD